MDRRSFLTNSAALAVHSVTSDLVGLEPQQVTTQDHPMAPPVSMQSSEQSQAPFAWEADGLVFQFEFQGNRLRFRHVLAAGVPAPAATPAATDSSGLEISILCTGEDAADHHGAKLTGGSPGTRLTFVNKQESVTSEGKRLVLIHEDRELGLRVESMYQAIGRTSVVRRATRVTNVSRQPVGLEYVSSAMLNNFADPASFQDDLRIHFAYNSWQAEAQWRTVRPAEAGLVQNGNFTVSGIQLSTTGSWPCQTFLPMAMIENVRLGVTWFWQVEHNGSWHCEISQTAVKSLYAYLGGPDAQHAQAWKLLAPGESFETIPVAVGCVQGGFDDGVAALTRYRRAILRHRRSDTRDCPVIFNDVVMLDGDQTTEHELPLIDAAADAGCEVFCMDVGWYTKLGENWWNGVGDWTPNPARFPGGFRKLTDAIRAKGMTPGLWIEPEVAGLQTSLARRPDAWFFMRHGKRVIDHSRYHLDFRNSEVRAYVDVVFHALIEDYGIGYIKLDYNINALEGTESRAESFGQGLLGHNRAFLAWMDALLERYPGLTIETVASGSMRMEYSMLSRAQLQSISDQDDYRLYSSITTGCSAAVLPEQMGVWSQPLEHQTPEIASCNMVNAMLGRIHQSGFLPRLSAEAGRQVKQGIAIYKTDIRRHIPEGIPFYPLGMPDMTRPHSPAALGMRSPSAQFLAVWGRSGPAEVRLRGLASRFRLLYPSDLGVTVEASGDDLVVRFPTPDMGCILRSL